MVWGYSLRLRGTHYLVNPWKPTGLVKDTKQILIQQAANQWNRYTCTGANVG
jgi:hypothetical protein